MRASYSYLGAKLAGFFSRSFIASFIHSEKLGRLITLRIMNEPLLVLAGFSRSVHSFISKLPSSWHIFGAKPLNEIQNRTNSRSSQSWQPPLHMTTFPWSYGYESLAIDRQSPLLHLVLIATRFYHWFSVDGPNYSAARILPNRNTGTKYCVHRRL